MRVDRTSNPRVSLLIYGLTGGGVPRLTITLALMLAERDWQVDVVCIDPKIKQPITQHPNLFFASATGWLGRLPWIRAKRKRQYALARWGFARYLRRAKPDLILAADISVDLIALHAGSRCAAKPAVVVSVHNSLGPLHQHKPKLIGGIRQNFHAAAAVVAVSRGIAEQLEDLGVERTRIRVLPNPVIGNNFMQRMASPAPDFDFSQAGPLIVAAGRLTAQKDYPSLLAAFRQVLDTLPGARLLILGDGPDRALLNNQSVQLGIDKNVHFAGAVADAVPYIARADVLALSSIQEGMPSVLIEALACGKRVVSTDCDTGPRDILDSGRYGRLVPIADSNAMAEALIQTLAEQYSVDMLKARGNEYSAERSVEAYIELFESLLNPAR